MASSSAAWAWPNSESSRPASMRDSSRTRASWSRRTTPLLVTLPSLDFATTRWLSANAATWGRWVTTMTCASLASLARRRPTSTAALPPTPASTSSKTNVGTGSAPAKTTSMASMTLDSSPPDAPLVSGRAGAPDLDLVRAVRAELCRRGDGDADPGVRHGQGRQLAGDLLGEPAGGLVPGGGELAGQLPGRRRELCLLGGEGGDLVVVAVQLAGPRGGGLGPAQHGGEVAAG